MVGIPSTCCMCYACCGIRVQKAGEVVVEITGAQDYPHNNGRLCAKGQAAIMGLYDPYRLKTPLRRSCPEKGLHIDPGWEEISWEEALDTIAEKLKKIRREDPRQLIQAGLDFNAGLFLSTYTAAFGTPNRWVGPAGYFCGNVLHPVHYLAEGAFYGEFDLSRCQYCLLVGSQMGFLVNLNGVTLAEKMAAARARGMKVVSVDPVMSTAAAKADEWVPIRPGTDAALALGMLNLLLNEWEIYDAPFLRKYTNAPYLVGPDGSYVRDEASGKPLVLNEGTDCAQPYTEVDPAGMALLGKLTVNGLPCLPAFQLLKEHVQKYDLGMVSKVTGIPAEKIGQLAKEFGEAARIGSTIVIDGKVLPFRPVAVVWTKGAGAHKHGTMAGWALHLLNIVVGAIDVPGGILGNRTLSPLWQPREGPDGLLVPGSAYPAGGAYPGRKAGLPQALDLTELMPIAGSMDPNCEDSILHPEKYQLDYRPQLMLHVNSNFFMTTSNPNRLAEVFKKVPFMVSFSIYLNETTAFADIVLPDCQYLERLLPFPNTLGPHGLTMGPGPWYWSIQQPVVTNNSQARPWIEVFLELANRADFSSDLNIMLNNALRLKEPYRLEAEKKYTLEEISDAWSKSSFGPEHGLEWFKANGFLTREKTIEEAYPRSFLPYRIPIYLEHLIRIGRDLEGVTSQAGIPWDAGDYRPLPDWEPCLPANQGDYDLYAVNFKLPFHTFSFTSQNPWLDELASHHPSAYKIMINTDAAEARGIRDGDTIMIESRDGKVAGQARVTPGVHPEVVGLAGAFGHWAKELPVAKGKGVHFNSLLTEGPDRIDSVSGALDTCVQVRVSKVSE
ncbi:MAG: molybdopterin-dependent oxidoreductase [Thermodesulfobacteriota bacterium]